MIEPTVKINTVFFEQAGKLNTEIVLNLAKTNADILGIKSIVIASTWGNSIQAAVKIFDPSQYNIICVTHNNNFKEDIEQEFPQDIRNQLELKGVHFVTGTLAFSGTSSALLRKYQ